METVKTIESFNGTLLEVVGEYGGITMAQAEYRVVTYLGFGKKVLIQVRNDALRNLLGHLDAAIKISNEMASSIPDQVKVVEQDTDEVKKKKKKD